MSVEGPIPIDPRRCGESSSNFRRHSSLIHSFEKNLLRLRLWLIRIAARSSHANRSCRRRHDPNRGQFKGKYARGSRPQKHKHKTNRLNKNKRELKGPDRHREAVRDVRLDTEIPDPLVLATRSRPAAEQRQHLAQNPNTQRSKRRSCPVELVVA